MYYLIKGRKDFMFANKSKVGYLVDKLQFNFILFVLFFFISFYLFKYFIYFLC